MSDLQQNKSSGGDPKTFIAVILSVLVIVGGVVINERFFPAPKPAAQALAPTTQPAQEIQPASGQAAAPAPTAIA
jgi:hypothetical protein